MLLFFYRSNFFFVILLSHLSKCKRIKKNRQDFTKSDKFLTKVKLTVYGSECNSVVVTNVENSKQHKAVKSNFGKLGKLLKK